MTKKTSTEMTREEMDAYISERRKNEPDYAGAWDRVCTILLQVYEREMKKERQAEISDIPPDTGQQTEKAPEQP